MVPVPSALLSGHGDHGRRRHPQLISHLPRDGIHSRQWTVGLIGLFAFGFEDLYFLTGQQEDGILEVAAERLGVSNPTGTLGICVTFGPEPHRDAQGFLDGLTEDGYADTTHRQEGTSRARY